MHERYRPLIESKVADLANSSNKRQAGAVYAAQFLREFTDGLPWCHVDIAGTGMVGGRAPGFGVRLILAVAERLAGAAAGLTRRRGRSSASTRGRREVNAPRAGLRGPRPASWRAG